MPNPNLNGLDPRIFGYEGGRIMHQRDPDREARASALYERLRLLSRIELADICGYDDSRQILIAEIIERHIKVATE